MQYDYLIRAKKMREQIKKELEGIPRGDIDQNMVRQAYWGIRSHNLGKRVSKPLSKEKTLIEAVKIVQKDNYCFWPEYNNKIFNQKKVIEVASKEKLFKDCKNRNLKNQIVGCKKNVSQKE